MIGCSTSAPDGESPQTRVPLQPTPPPPAGQRPTLDAQRLVATVDVIPVEPADVVRSSGPVDAILLDQSSATATRASTKMVAVARDRDATIWDQAGTEPSRGGDPFDFLFDPTAVEASTSSRPQVARLAAPLRLGGDTIDTIFGGGGSLAV